MTILRHDIREFKIERVQQVKILESSYEIRDNFDPYDYLTQAWGVMGGDERIVVKLRFSPDVAYRVRESDWPCVDTIEDLSRWRLSHDINRESHAGNETLDSEAGAQIAR